MEEGVPNRGGPGNFSRVLGKPWLILPNRFQVIPFETPRQIGLTNYSFPRPSWPSLLNFVQPFLQRRFFELPNSSVLTGIFSFRPFFKHFLPGPFQGFLSFSRGNNLCPHLNRLFFFQLTTQLSDRHSLH